MKTRPFLPSDRRDGARPSDHLIRYVVAHAIGELSHDSIDRVVARLWPSDAGTGLLTKGATDPASMTTSGWASTLAQTAVGDFLVGLGPASAGAALLARGTQFQFGDSAAILAPGALSAASKAAFVTEAAPIPVEQLAISGPTLSPRKFATIGTYSGETFRHSIPNIEAFVKTVLTESVGHALDSALFDDQAGDATRAAGLRAGISVTAASAATPDTDAMYEDLSTLAGVVAAVAGSSPIVFVASPRQAAAIKMRQPNFAYEVLASSGLAAGMVLAIASNALVSAADPVPRVEVSSRGTLVFDDTSPAQLGVSGTPAVVGAPARSLWQSDLLSIRLILEISWALRTSGGLAWTQSVIW